MGQSIATETTTLRVKLYKPPSVKEVVTTKKQPLAQRPLLQDNLTQGQRGETKENKNLPAPITQKPDTHSNAAPRLVQTLSESMGNVDFALINPPPPFIDQSLRPGPPQ